MRITFNLSIDEANVFGLFNLYDVIVCDRYLGRPMPPSFSEDDEKQLKFVFDYIFAL